MFRSSEPFMLDRPEVAPSAGPCGEAGQDGSGTQLCFTLRCRSHLRETQGCGLGCLLFIFRAFSGSNDFTSMDRLLFQLDMIPSAHKGLPEMRFAVGFRPRARSELGANLCVRPGPTG